MSLVNFRDLRRFSRDSDRVLTQIRVEDDALSLIPWLTLGEISLTHDRSGSYTLRAPLSGGATDEEHDTADLLRIELIGLRFDCVYRGLSVFEAYIRPPGAYNHDNFRVPAEDFKMSGKFCSWCPANGRPPHLITDYLPPHNKELSSLLAGRRIEIWTGAARESVSPDKDSP